MSKMSEFRKKGRKSREKVGFGPDVFVILFCTERKICAAEEKPLANFEELCYTFKVPVLGSGTNPFGRHLRRDNTDPDL